MVPVGTLPLRAGVGHRARGLLRRRRRLELLPVRPRPLARLPLERGRPGRSLRPPAGHLLRAGVSGTAATRSSRSGSSASTGTQGNHGEDAKEYWWYLDAVPSHSWLRWRYHYPQAEFPYERPGRENAARTATSPSSSCIDTGIFDDDRYWVVDVDYAKASPTDICMRIR